MDLTINIDLKPQSATLIYKGKIELMGYEYPFEVRMEQEKDVVFWPEDNFPQYDNEILELFKNKVSTATIAAKHEYLEREDYYESRSVNKGRSDKTCGHCGGNIPIGTPHLMMHFYPEFNSYAVHEECEQPFIDSLL